MISLLLLGATILLAENTPAWKAKPVEKWDMEDAKQILEDSPRVGRATLQMIPDRSPGERRDSGDWDAGAGEGLGPAALVDIIGGPGIARAHHKPSPGTAEIRWESAMPVRTAEAKLAKTPAPAQHNDWYAITLYNVPLPESRWGAGKLKGLAWLKRENRRDFKPSRVEIVRNDDGRATITYLFSRSGEISRRDRVVLFAAQLDRLFVSEFFFPGNMLIADQLEL